MGSAVDRFLQQTSPSTGAASSAPVPSLGSSPAPADSLVDQFLAGVAPTQPLGVANQAAPVDPERAARSLRIRAKTGLPRDLVERNLDAIEAESQKADFDPERFRRTSPLVAQWLAQDPDHLGVARNDLAPLSYLERQVRTIRNQFQAGRATVELQDIGEAAMRGTVTPEQRKRQAEIDQQLGEQQDYGIGERGGVLGFLEGVPGAIANQLPIFASTLKGKAVAAAAASEIGLIGGAALGAAGAGVVGQAGPQAALPEEVLTVPAAAAGGGIAGARTGAIAGWRYGAAIQAGRMEAALAYLEFEKVRDANGQPLDRTTMLGAAAITGVLNGALEMTGFESVAKTIPGLRALGKAELKKALVQQTVRQAVARYAKSVGEAMLTEGATEFMQDVVKNSAGELSTMIQDGSIKTMSPGAILDRIFSPQHLAEAVSDAKAGAQGGGGMAFAGGAVSLTSDIRRARAAEPAKTFFQAIGTGAAGAQLTERLPEKMQEVVAAVTKDGPAETVYAPIATWNEYWQSQAVDPAAVAEEITGSPAAYEEAMRTGSDLVIPTARYATTIAPTEHNAFFVNELRLNPEHMNAREADAFAKAMDQLDAEQQAAAAPDAASTTAVESQLVEQLTTAGFDPSTAETYAQPWLAFVRTLASSMGTDPAAVMERIGLSVQRGEAPGEAAGREVTESAAEASATASGATEPATQAAPAAPAATGKVIDHDGTERFQAARTASGTRRPAPKVSTQGLVGELLDLETKRADAEQRSVYELHDDPDFHTSGIPQIVSTKGKNGGASRQAKALRNLADFQRITDEIYAELEARGLSADDVTQRLEDERAARDERAGLAGDFDYVQAINDVFTDDAGRELFQPALAQPVALTKHTSFSLPLKETGRDTPIHQLTIATPKGDVLVDLIEHGRGAPLEISLIQLASDNPANQLGPAVIRQVGGILKQTFPEASGVEGMRISGASIKAGVRGRIAEFHQAADGAPRGRIRIGERSLAIDLFQTADLSTFLHETGHAWLEVMHDFAAQPDAPARLVRDVQTIREWLGAEGNRPLTREQHEQFARATEAYFLEGKAPTAALQTAFSRFRAWLLGVYRSLRGLNVELTPEVRGVFDRLLATDDEITQAQQEQAMVPLFADPEQFGMTPEQAEGYRAAVEHARQSAEDELAAKLLADLTREQKAWWKTEREQTRERVARRVDQEPAVYAKAVLQRGTLPDGSALPEDMDPIKFSREGLAAVGGAAAVKALPFTYRREGGLHPDQVAELLGFDSGHALVDALVSSEPRSAKIERLTDEQMKAEHGDLLTDGTLPEAAMQAVHNEGREQLLRTELEHLSRQLRTAPRRVAPLAAVRAQAERTIAGKVVRAIAPPLYRTAEARAAREALAALLAGDVEGAFEAKQRELVNHELYRAATAARETVDKIVTYMRSFDAPSTRARIGKAGADYLAQIDAIRDRYSFTPLSRRALDNRQGLLAWIRQQEKAGNELDLPDDVLDEARRQHYKDTTVEELTGVRDAVQQIAHLAKTKNALLKSARARTMDEARTEIIGAIGAHHALRVAPTDLRRGFRERLKAGMRRKLAEHTRLEFLFRYLDGEHAGGVVWQYFFKPMAEAEDRENTMRRADAEALAKIFGAYTRRERAQWFAKTIRVPGTATAKVQDTFTTANVLAIALNWGNDYNRGALMEGAGWTQAQVERILATLDARDWATVQAIWDHIDTYWPAARDLEQSITGLAPEKVEASPFQIRQQGDVSTVHELRGGYYPIAFDRAQSSRQVSLDHAASVKEMFGGSPGRAMTRHGHLKERIGTGGKPLRLELSVLSDHLAAVVHDLAYREAVIDVAKLMRDPDIQAAIEGAAGREMYQQLEPWLRTIAGDRPHEAASDMEKLMSHARNGATVVNLGWKMTSAVVQTLGYSLSVKELGPKYAAAGIRAAYGNPLRLGRQWEFIAERSPMMRDRVASFDREVRDYTRQADGLGRFGVDPSIFFAFIGYMDLGTSIPTWLGAYRKAMDGRHETIAGGDEQAAIDYADSVVRTTQAAGAAKDLARVQQGTEAWRWWTMFYTSQSILFNQFAQTHRQFQLTKNVPQLLGGLTLVWFMPAVLEDVLRGRAPSGDDDDDESFLHWALRKELTYPFATVILVRDVVNALDQALVSGRVDLQGSSAIGALESIAKTGYALYKAASGAELTPADWKEMVMTAGYFAKLPTRQLWQTGKYFTDWLSGDLEPSNPAVGLWQGLVTGSPR